MTGAAVDRHRLQALRYAAGDEAAQHIAIMRAFTSATSGLLSDLSAAEVLDRLPTDLALDVDIVEQRLGYLVEHGNLVRSPRETEARSIREYLSTRARYQLTQRGELVHRHVEQLLASTDEVREVSTEMLAGILAGLRRLRAYDETSLARAEPDEVALHIGTLFAQLERLVTSTRDFYASLGQVLSRYDLDREDFQAFKAALIDYLQRFVDEVARTMPQVADELRAVEPAVPALLERANQGARLTDGGGVSARRGQGLQAEDWEGLRSWFLGAPGRRSDAEEVRALATRAMRALLVNLRRIATSRENEVSRYADLLRLAGWFDTAEPDAAHALWASAFGLYPSRHLSFVADADGDPAPATSSWWRSPVADVPVMLRASGERRVAGVAGRREDFTVAKARRVAERERAERERQAALDELVALRGSDRFDVSDAARTALLELYARALTAGHEATTVAGDGERLLLRVSRRPGSTTTVRSPAGVLHMVDLRLELA